MADKEQIKRLRKGVDEWNKWRKKYPLIRINLMHADLRKTDLDRAELWRADLVGAKTSHAYFRKSNLERADLRNADLEGANLSDANLWSANLLGTDLRGADLQGANLTYASVGGTILWDVNLNKTKGLDEVRHMAPSIIGTGTFQRSKGNISEKFMRGCGLSDVDIEYEKLFQEGLSSKEVDDILYRIHDLRIGQAIQINPLFISYSHKDSAFVDAMEKRLDEKGIRFWRDIHEMTPGRLEKIVDRAMRQNPTVLLVLSENSVQSDWVEHEARSARELEKELGRDVLCPVALDDAWKDCKWPARLREQIQEYHIMDFSNWKDEVEFGKKFVKLIEGLDLFYKEGK